MNGETKPRIHLVKKVAKTSAISMAVEDEVEVMDDSEDELIVNRSTENRDYSRSESKAHLYKLNSEDLEDDTEEELSLLYEDDDTEDVKPTANELKELNGDHKADEDDNEETAEMNNQISSESYKFDKNEQQPDTPTPTATAIEATELIKEKTIEFENNKSEVSEAISNEKEMDTDEDKPLARRRRSLIKVVQPTSTDQSNEDLRNHSPCRKSPSRKSKRSLSPKKYYTDTSSNDSKNNTDDEVEDNSKKNGNHNILENESIIKTEEVDLSSSDQVEQPAELEVEPPTEPEVEPPTEPEVEPPTEPDVEEESAKSCQSYNDAEVSKENNSSEEQTKVEENSCEAQTSLPPEVKEETESEDRQSLAESLMEDEDDQNDNTDAASSTGTAETMDEDAIPSTFELGDLAWSRVGTAPYWPSVICHDPDTKKFTQVKESKRQGLHRVFHVKFFGGQRGKRAWVDQPHMLKFEGLEAFQELSNSATGSKQKAAFCPKYGNTKTIWLQAINECVSVVEKSNDERIELSHTRTETPTLGKKRRRPSCDSPDLPQNKKIKFETAEKLIEAIPEDVLDKNRRKLKTGFKLYQLAHRSDVMSKHGGADTEKTLNKMWDSASAAEKRFFQDKAADFMKPKKDENSNADQATVPAEEETKIMITDERLSKIDDQSESTTTSDSTSETIPTPKRKPGRPFGSSNKNTTPKSADPTPKRKVGRPSFKDKTTPTTKTPNSNNSKVKTPSSSNNGHNEIPNDKRDSMVGLGFKKESCCLICEEVSQEKNNVLVKCKGTCQSSYHISCLGEPDLDPAIWKCSQCTTGLYKCQLCQESEGTVMKCQINFCGRYFHEHCLLKHGLWPQARIAGDKILSCPAHTCHTCASDNPKDPYMKYNDKLLKCIRCPTAYHHNDFCVAAGSVQITATQIVCPKHFEPPESKKKTTWCHVSTGWCFICSKGGSLICCELCPSSFHIECLKINIDSENDKYFCDHCETGRMPLYGEVVWVKLGTYRWWPAQVLHPSEVPPNIEKLPHDIGEFPIQFCGSHEYFWMNRGRCFLYDEGDITKFPAIKATSGKDAAYKRGLIEAAELFQKYTQERDKREKTIAANSRLNSNLKPPLFNKIKSNRPFGDCPVYTADPTDKALCECDPESNQTCGEGSDCINRLLMQECRPSTCRSGEKCQNQRFQRRKYPPLKVTRTKSRGWGLFNHADIKRGDFIIEYVGEMITIEEFKMRIDRSIKNKEEQNYYYMTMDNNRMLDAGPRGNIARFVNHSCDPNSETQKWTVNGDTRIGLFALKDLPAGSELTFNYQFESMGDQKKLCLCGAKNCSGYIGEKAHKLKKEKVLTPKNGDLKKKIKLKKKVEEKFVKIWEDVCFRCFEDGEVLMCDWKTCPKVYHLGCLGREKLPPRGAWYCPWHFCTICGKSAVSHCIHCPNGYCKKHEDMLQKHKELGMICDEHKDDLADLVKFYRKTGGVKHLITHPNVPVVKTNTANVSTSTTPTRTPKIRETDIQDTIANHSTNDDEDEEMISDRTPKVKKTVTGKENSNRAGRISRENRVCDKNPFMYKCSVNGCEFRNRRNRLKTHYINAHDMSEEEASKKVPPKLTIANLKKIECEVCKQGCIPTMLRRHLFNAHSELTIEQVNTIFEKAVTKSDEKNEKLSTDEDIDIEKHPLFSKVEPDGRIKCKAPECTHMVSAQNIARHWHQYHPKLTKNEYQPSLQMLLKMIREGSSNTTDASSSSEVTSGTPVVVNNEADLHQPAQRLETKTGNGRSITPTKSTPTTSLKTPTSTGTGNKRKSCGHPGCDFRTSSLVAMTDHRKSLGHSQVSPIKKSRNLLKSTSAGTGSSPSRATLLCGYKDCDFTSKYLSNLSRHRRRRNHFITDEDKKSALAEQKRDELAKKIEQSQESSTEEEDEFDVTIPLTQKLSPSKITDYFKPVKKVVKMASLDDENNENSKQNTNSSEAAATAQVIPPQPPKENNFKAKPVLEQ